MALIEHVQHKQPKQAQGWDRLRQQLLLVPEAAVLVAVLLLGWAFSFPPLLSILALITMLVFGIRIGLLTWAERQLGRGAYEQADKLARAALRINPWSSDALVLQAQGHTHQGDDEGAEQLLRRAVSLYPSDQMLRSALASTLFAQGRIKEGWQIAGVVQAAHIKSPQIVQQQAWMALHVEEDAAKARNLIEAIQPMHYAPRITLPLLATLGEAQIVLGARDEAEQLIATIENTLSACDQPQQAELLYHIGRMKTALGQDGTAAFRRSVELDPDGRYAHLAWRSAVNAAA